MLSASFVERYFSSCDVDSVDLSVENSMVLTRLELSDVVLDLNFVPYLLGLRDGMSMDKLVRSQTRVLEKGGFAWCINNPLETRIPIHS